MCLRNATCVADSRSLQWQLNSVNSIAVVAEDKREMALSITAQFKTCCS